MHIKSILAGAAIAVAATIGSTSTVLAGGPGFAGGPMLTFTGNSFAAIQSIPVSKMTHSELQSVYAAGSATFDLVFGQMGDAAEAYPAPLPVPDMPVVPADVNNGLVNATGALLIIRDTPSP